MSTIPVKEFTEHNRHTNINSVMAKGQRSESHTNLTFTHLQVEVRVNEKQVVKGSLIKAPKARDVRGKGQIAELSSGQNYKSNGGAQERSSKDF